MQFPEYNEPTNRILEDLQRLIEFLQKYEGTPFVASQSRGYSGCCNPGLPGSQVNWEFVTGYIVTSLGQITQIQEAA